MTPAPLLESFYDPATCTVSHLLACPRTRRAAVIDPVLDYQAAAGRIRTHSAERLVERVQALGLQVDWLLETHAHADHLSAAYHLQQRLGGRIGIGAGIAGLQRHFGPLLNATDLSGSGQEFDTLFAEGDVVPVGELNLQVLHTPGHTPACLSYYLPGAPGCVFVGDTLFMPDYGSARADFPGGDAQQLYRSIQRLLALPPDTRLLLCHDYPPGERAPAFSTSVAAQRAANVHVHEGVDEAAFVAMRQARDAGLAVPALLWPSLQVNLRAGRLPPPEANGIAYLKTPLNLKP